VRAVTIGQRPARVEDLELQLLEQFTAAREALLAGRPVIFEVSASDLLGHGGVADAALANAMVGLARALALEGVRAGWRVNVVARESGGDVDTAFLDDLALTGQLLHLGSGHLGRVAS
jgi:hypothetical protein